MAGRRSRKTKRPVGALEDEVMSYLWTVGEPSSPGEVQRAIGADLAYTTIMTVLTRLWDKGMLDRQQRGRAYAYVPVQSEADHRAGQMTSTLARSDDRRAVLTSFVAGLGRRDTKMLRTILDESGR